MVSFCYFRTFCGIYNKSMVNYMIIHLKHVKVGPRPSFSRLVIQTGLSALGLSKTLNFNNCQYNIYSIEYQHGK